MKTAGIGCTEILEKTKMEQEREREGESKFGDIKIIIEQKEKRIRSCVVGLGACH